MRSNYSTKLLRFLRFWGYSANNLIRNPQLVYPSARWLLLSWQRQFHEEKPQWYCWNNVWTKSDKDYDCEGPKGAKTVSCGITSVDLWDWVRARRKGGDIEFQAQDLQLSVPVLCCWATTTIPQSAPMYVTSSWCGVGYARGCCVGNWWSRLMSNIREIEIWMVKIP